VNNDLKMVNENEAVTYFKLLSIPLNVKPARTK
jgi:hypothetical protein